PITALADRTTRAGSDCYWCINTEPFRLAQPTTDHALPGFIYGRFGHDQPQFSGFSAKPSCPPFRQRLSPHGYFANARWSLSRSCYQHLVSQQYFTVSHHSFYLCSFVLALWALGKSIKTRGGLALLAFFK